MDVTEDEITGVGAINGQGEVWLWLWDRERRGRMTGVSMDGDRITVEGDYPVSRRYPQQVVLAMSAAKNVTIAFVDEENTLLDAIDLPITTELPA